MHGQVYYFNRRDGTTTWDKPEGFVSKLAPEAEGEAGVAGQDQEEGELEEGEMDEEDEEATAAAAAGQGQWGQQRWGEEGGGGGGGAEGEGEEPPQVMMTTAEYEAQQYRARLEQLRRERELQQECQGETSRLAPSSPTVPFGGSAPSGPMQPVSPQHSPGAEPPSVPRPTSPKEPAPSSQAAAAAAAPAAVSPSPRRLSLSPRKLTTAGTVEGPAAAEQEQEQAEAEMVVEDPRAELERVRARLGAEDAIMEPHVMREARAFVQEWERVKEGGHLRPEEARRGMDNVLNELLASGYRGFANMALLVTGWLQGLSGDGTEQDDVEADEVVLEHLKVQVRHNFDLDKADALLFGRRQDMAFIDEMMAHARWRRLLMEIFAAHRESKLLGGYCMQHMSRAGHNTEMADIISVEDYWSVARGVLTVGGVRTYG